MTTTDDFQASHERYRQASSRANTANKETVFTALQAANIDSVTIEFEGMGDSGQIEDVAASTANSECAIPELSVRMLSVDRECDVTSESAQTLRDAIETLCWDFLAQEYGGWENNDGSYGEFQFDVATGTIALEFNYKYTKVYRYTDIQTFNHSF